MHRCREPRLRLIVLDTIWHHYSNIAWSMHALRYTVIYVVPGISAHDEENTRCIN